MPVVESALGFINADELSAANFAAIPTAQLGICLLKQGGAKHPKSEWINPFSQMIDDKDFADKVTKRTAQIILRLIEQRKIPRFVPRSELDLDRCARRAKN